METTGFLWTFPSFALATNVTIDPVTGGVLLDDNIRFIAPCMPTEQHIAIFTDSDLAEEYRELCNRDLDLHLLPLADPEALRSFFIRARGRFRNAVIDPNPKTRIGRIVPLDDAIPQLARWKAG